MQCHAVILDITGHDRHSILASEMAEETETTLEFECKKYWWVNTQNDTEEKPVKEIPSAVVIL